MVSTTLSHAPETILPPDDDALYEVVDGQRVELAPMGAYEVRIATILAARLETFAHQHRLGRAGQEMLFDFTAALQRKRRPDVAFVSFDRWPQQRRIPRAEAWQVVPNLVVEVVSPSDKAEHVMTKVAEYFQVGVERVWVIWPAQEHVYVYESPTSVRILSHADTLHGEPVLPQFQLPVAVLFDDIEAAAQP